MRFPGAFISNDDDGVGVLFTSFDDTDLSDTSNWTEAWQNEDPSAPAGFVHPGMILAEAARRLLEVCPELRQSLDDFVAKGEDTTDRREPARLHTVRTVEDLGMLCLSMWEELEQHTRVRPTPPIPR